VLTNFTRKAAGARPGEDHHGPRWICCTSGCTCPERKPCAVRATWRGRARSGGSQFTLERNREISQLLIDGILGDNFPRPLSFYLSRYKEYLESIKGLAFTAIERRDESKSSRGIHRASRYARTQHTDIRQTVVACSLTSHCFQLLIFPGFLRS
jgi:hypothetical protein